MPYTNRSRKQDFIAYRDPWVLYTGGGGTPDGGGTAYHALTLLSTPNHAGDPLTLAEGHQASVFHPAGTEFMTLNQTLCRHNLKQH